MAHSWMTGMLENCDSFLGGLTDLRWFKFIRLPWGYRVGLRGLGSEILKIEV
jgi:hypothetical protein